MDYMERCGIGLEGDMENRMVNLDENLDMKFMDRDLGGGGIDLWRLGEGGCGMEVRKERLLGWEIDGVIEKLEEGVIEKEFGELIDEFGEYDEVSEEKL